MPNQSDVGPLCYGGFFLPEFSDSVMFCKIDTYGGVLSQIVKIKIKKKTALRVYFTPNLSLELLEWRASWKSGLTCLLSWGGSTAVIRLPGGSTSTPWQTAAFALTCLDWRQTIYQVLSVEMFCPTCVHLLAAHVAPCLACTSRNIFRRRQTEAPFFSFFCIF